MASYVARHALVVLLFSGRQAHEGDDHMVLARNDRRIALTVFLYISALLPAFFWESLGKVLAITGAIGGSCLSYLGPGVAFLGIHGEEFLNMVQKSWSINNTLQSCMCMYPHPGGSGSGMETKAQTNLFVDLIRFITWYAFLMPLWVTIARAGKAGFAKFEEEQIQKSPAVHMRLGKILHATESTVSTSEEEEEEEENGPAKVFKPLKGHQRASSFNESSTPLLHVHGRMDDDVVLSERKSLLTKPMLIPPSSKHSTTSDYGTVPTKGIELTGGGQENKKNVTSTLSISDEEEEEENDPQLDIPWTEFVVAILFMILGAVALFAGLISIGAS